jgi:hypothetical protein
MKMQTTIEIFKMTDRKTLERSPIDKGEISKIFNIVNPRDVEGGLNWPLPDILGAANGDIDVAICARACDWQHIQIAVPTGQRHLVQNLG